MTTNGATPHELNTEKAIIGMLLRSSFALDSLVEIAAGISPEWFMDDRHRLAYQAMANLAFQGGRNSWDPSVVSLATQSKVELAYLIELATVAPNPNKLEAISKELVEQVTVRRFKTLATRVISWDKSPAELIHFAQSGFVNAIDASVGNTLEDMDTQMTLWKEEVERERALGGKNIVYSGVPDVDRRIGGFRPGEVYYFAGRPGTGKTAWALNIALFAGMRGHRCAIFSLEMLRRQMINRLLCIAETYMSSSADELLLDSGVVRAVAELDLKRDRSVLARIDECDRWLRKHGNFSTDYSSVLNSTEIMAKSRRLKRQKGLGLIVVDYLQLMSEEGRSRQEEIGKMTKGLKRIAKDLEVPVVALAQLNREIEKRDSNSRPMMSDLRESGDIENDADYIGFLYEHITQTHGAGVIELISRKVRSTAVGTDLLKAQLKHFRMYAPTDVEKLAYEAQAGIDGKGKAEGTFSMR